MSKDEDWGWTWMSQPEWVGVSAVGRAVCMGSRRAVMTSIQWKIIKNKLVPVAARERERVHPEKAILYFNAELNTYLF